jgi:hypothetical protein
VGLAPSCVVGEGLRGGGTRHLVEVVPCLLGRLSGSPLERSAGLAGLGVIGVVDGRVAASIRTPEGPIADSCRCSSLAIWIDCARPHAKRPSRISAPAAAAAEPIYTGLGTDSGGLAVERRTALHEIAPPESGTTRE